MFMTSDFLIYNILQKSDDEFIRKCNLKFIDKSVPASEDDTIYVANVDLENNQELYDGTQYKALVNVYVKTKNTNYIKGSRFLRTVVKHIKDELKNDEECRARKITFRNITFEYGSGYTLKGLHMLIQLLEFEPDDLDDMTCVDFNMDDIRIEKE